MNASSDVIDDVTPDANATTTMGDGVRQGAPMEKKPRSGGPVDPRLVRRAKATRPYMISGVVVGSITAVLILIQAKLLSGSIASVFATHTLAGLGLTLGLLALVLIGRGILAWASSWLAQRTSAAVKSQLRRDILAARLGSPALQTSSSSTLVTLVTHGLDSLDGYFSKYLPQLLLAVTVPIILGVALLVTDWRTAIIIAVTIPFIPILMMLIGWTTQKQMKRRWVFQSRLASHFADLVSGLPTLQVFGRAKAQAAGLKRTEDANRRESLSILKYAFLSAFALEMFSTIAVAVVALIIATRLVYGQMDFTTALFVLILAPEVYLPLRQVGTHYHDSAEGLAAAEAAFAEIDRGGSDLGESGHDPRKTGGRDRGAVSPDPDEFGRVQTSEAMYPPSILVRDLRYTYPDSTSTLGPYNVRIEPGEVVALAGRSGGGKTTLLNCLLGFLSPDRSGAKPDESTGLGLGVDGTTPDADGIALGPNPPALTLGGVSSTAIDWRRWRAGIAYVPQTPGMIDGTIADNVRLGCPEASDDQVGQVLAEVGASSLDLDRSVGEEGEGLSGGERRRVGLARALARIQFGGGRLLILDEPTAGLDSDTEARVLRSLRRSGATALVVSHREAVLAGADRVITIGDPAVVASGLGQVGPDSDKSSRTPADVSEPRSELSLDASRGQVVELDLLGQSEASAQAVSASGAPISPAPPLQPSASGSRTAAPQPRTAAPPTPAPAPLTSPTSAIPKSTTTSPLLRLVFSLLNAIPGAKLRLIAAIIFAACASGAAIALMGLSAWLISKAAQHPPFLELSVGAVGVRFFGISRGVFRYIERLVGHDTALSMQSALRLRTYEALARTTLLGRRQGDLLVRAVADVNSIDDIIVRIVQPFAAASLVVIGTCLILAQFSPAASIVIAISAFLGGVVVPWLTQRASLRADEAMVPLRGDLGVVVHDISRTATDVAAYGRIEPALNRMSTVDATLRRLEERAAWAQGIGAGLQTIVAGLGFVGGLWIGSIAVVNGSMNERLLAVLVLTPMALHEVFANFAKAAQTWTRAKVALGRVMAIFDAPPVGRGDVVLADAGRRPSVTCADLTIGWPGHPVVASGLSLEVDEGEAVAVMGPSGIGKTTLAATIMGLIPPVAGQLETTGRIGYLAQDAHIFSTTVAENVRIGNKDATDDQVRAALTEAGLDIDLDRELGELGAGLSGGEARRLALARLFVGDDRLLILDEPTEHLDRETADALMDDIFASIDHRPAIIITHDEAVAARCGTVLMIEHRFSSQ